MAIIETGFEQQSDEWFKARLGSPGASSMKKIITSAGKQSKTRGEYLLELAAEQVRGKADETFKSTAMEEGSRREEEARSFFELTHNVDIQKVAMVYKDERKLWHISPDGLIGEDTGIEIKNPLAKTHAKYLIDDKVPSTYFVQIQSSLYTSERKYWWFLSYVDGMRPFEKRVERDEVFIASLKFEVELFCREMAVIVEKIK